MADRPRIVILAGPTAVGKTEVAVEVARRFATDIVSADSMQVYRRMEAGTAKPSPEQRTVVPHHLVGFVDPSVDFTVADYRAAAITEIDRLIAEGKVPLVSGGTRLYLKSLTAPFATGPAPDPALRARLASLPSGTLHEELAAVDPEAAARLHPSDRKRLTRALEVFQATGEPISVVQRRSQAEGGRYDALWLALVRDRQELYRRVEARVDAMLDAGLVEEVCGFLQEGLGPERIAMQAHGYKEIMGALLQQYDLEEGIRLLRRNTRRYVKYQLMWLRGEPAVHWVDAARSLNTVADECVRLIETES